MNKLNIIMGMVFCCSVGAQAAITTSSKIWYSGTDKDEFTNTITHSARGGAGTYFVSSGKTYFNSDPGNYFGLRCDVLKSGTKDFMLTFDVKNTIATPNSNVSVYLKVDEHEPIKLMGKLYTNSYKSGFIKLNSSNQSKVKMLISQSIAGHQMLVRVSNERKSEINTFSVMLRGFTRNTSKALKACEIAPAQPLISAEDNARLKEIIAQIKALEKEKSDILSKY